MVPKKGLNERRLAVVEKLLSRKWLLVTACFIMVSFVFIIDLVSPEYFDNRVAGINEVQRLEKEIEFLEGKKLILEDQVKSLEGVVRAGE